MHRRGLLFLSLAGAGLLLAVVVPRLPPPFATPSADNPPRVVPKPPQAGLRLAPGFHMDVFAQGFLRPRYMALDPENRVVLADSADAPDGSVYVFEGRQRKKVIGGLNRPSGLAFWNGYLYVGEPTSVKRYRYDARTVTVGPGEEVVSLKGFTSDHWTRYLLFDREGKKLYVAVGSGSNDTPGGPPQRAAINQYNPDGSGHVIYASGTRNPTALGWYPGRDTLWASVQERDTFGNNLPPDYLTHIRQGGFYGWPYAYIGPHPDPLNGKLRPDLVAKTIVPDVLLGPHVAVMDFIFYTGSQFPQEYRGGAFVTFHGSWNRSKRIGYTVAFQPFTGGEPAGKLREVVTGWMLSQDERDVWGRPVGLLQMPDGSVLISDDGGKKVWKLRYKP